MPPLFKWLGVAECLIGKTVTSGRFAICRNTVVIIGTDSTMTDNYPRHPNYPHNRIRSIDRNSRCTRCWIGVLGCALVAVIAVHRTLDPATKRGDLECPRMRHGTSYSVGPKVA